MKYKFLCSLLILSVSSYSQDVKFSKIQEIALKNGSKECIYQVEVYNDTNNPICFPVSLSFGFTFNDLDTGEVVNIYPAIDSIVTLSLYYAKADISGSSAKYPALPVIINPNTYAVSNIKFEKPENKHVYLELKYSNDTDLDYHQINKSFQNEPMYRWMDKLHFVNNKFFIF
jgi:hypothetical protein